MGAPDPPAESPAPAGEVAPDYEKLYEDVKAKPCRVDRIDRAYEATGRKPLRTRSTIIDRELEVGVRCHHHLMPRSHHAVHHYAWPIAVPAHTTAPLMALAVSLAIFTLCINHP